MLIVLLSFAFGAQSLLFASCPIVFLFCSFRVVLDTHSSPLGVPLRTQFLFNVIASTKVINSPYFEYLAEGVVLHL